MVQFLLSDFTEEDVARNVDDEEGDEDADDASATIQFGVRQKSFEFVRFEHDENNILQEWILRKNFKV